MTFLKSPRSTDAPCIIYNCPTLANCVTAHFYLSV